MIDVEKLGKYELRATLGSGAMATVYDGWDPIIARRVAIKTVRLTNASDEEARDQVARFRREAQAAGRLQHPNIVSVFDYGESAELAWIVMEFVDGGSLKDIMDRKERFSPDGVLRIMEPLLAALQYSHERGVVHRDIKPANVMLTKDRTVKIADFGIARIEQSSMTQIGTVLGTPTYMSPEQFMGQPVDARTDIYSAGVLLFNLLTGERPFEGGMTALMHRTLHTEPPKPSDLSVAVPDALDAVVARAMAKRPADRFQTARTMADAIRAGFAEPPEPDTGATLVWPVPGSPPYQPAAQPGRIPDSLPALPPPAASGRPSRLPAWIAGLVALLAAGGGAGWFLLSKPAEVTTAAIPAPAKTQPAPPPTPVSAPPSASAEPVVPPPPPTARVEPTPPAAIIAPVPPTSPQAAPGPPPPVAPPAAPDLREAVASQPCSLVKGTATNDTAQLWGVAQRKSAGVLRAALDAVPQPNRLFRVTEFDRPDSFCLALDALRPAAPPFGATTGLLDMALVPPKPGQPVLYDGDRMRLDLIMPNFSGWLTIDYLTNDRALAHMAPHDALDAQHFPPRRLDANAHVRLFDETPAFRGWEVGEPYGTDLIIAVVSASKLFAAPQPEPEENVDAYLTALRRAIAAARANGDRLAVAAVTVPTARRR